MAYCVNCGTKLSPGDTACPACGSPLPADTAGKNENVFSPEGAHGPAPGGQSYGDPRYSAGTAYPPRNEPRFAPGPGGAPFPSYTAGVLQNYISEASTIGTYGIISIICTLTLGFVGLIFALITKSKIKNLIPPDPSSLDPASRYAAFEAERKIKSANSCATASIAIFCVITALAVLAGIAFLIFGIFMVRDAGPDIMQELPGDFVTEFYFGG